MSRTDTAALHANLRVIANRNSYIEETDPVRRLVSFIGISLDGYYQGPNGEFDFANVDQEFYDFSNRQDAYIDTLMFGRETYELMAAYRSNSGGPRPSDPATSCWSTARPEPRQTGHHGDRSDQHHRQPPHGKRTTTNGPRLRTAHWFGDVCWSWGVKTRHDYARLSAGAGVRSVPRTALAVDEAQQRRSARRGISLPGGMGKSAAPPAGRLVVVRSESPRGAAEAFGA
jgi:hypothetical protein